MNETRRPKKQRSPSFPAIDLATALVRARQLWEKEGRHWAPVPAILEAWNYSPKSSGGMIAIGALKRYELLEDRGSLATREARLTELGHAIVLDEREGSIERDQRIREAALNPTIHREVWEKYDGKLPSDSTLRYYLTVERGFTAGGANDFIDEFKQTVAFAKLTDESDTVSQHEPEPEAESRYQAWPGSILAPLQWGMGASAVSNMTVATPPSRGAPPPIQFPVVGATVIFQTTAPLSETAWDQMMTVLQTLKPAMVVKGPDPVLGHGADDDRDSE